MSRGLSEGITALADLPGEPSYLIFSEALTAEGCWPFCCVTSPPGEKLNITRVESNDRRSLCLPPVKPLDWFQMSFPPPDL